MQASPQTHTLNITIIRQRQPLFKKQVTLIKTQAILASGPTTLKQCSSNNSTLARKSFLKNSATKLTISTTTKNMTRRSLMVKNSLPAKSSNASPTPSIHLLTVSPLGLTCYLVLKLSTCVMAIRTTTQDC